MPTGFTQDALAEHRDQIHATELQQPTTAEATYDWPTDTENLPDLDSRADWNIK